MSKHFAILGTTGVGKSNGVAIILQRILDEKPDLRIFLIDPHNEYGRCFGEKAQVLTPRNLRLPFWLFNFEETIDAFFGGRPGIDEEVEILSEVIPLAKAAYGQYKGNTGSAIAKKKETRSSGYGVDTPVPYRIEDLLALIDERMGKLENRSSRMTYHKLHPAHSDVPQSSALRLHVRERHRRRRHHGRGAEPPVPVAGERQADDDHAARRFPGRGRRTRWCRCSRAWPSISDCGATVRRRCLFVCEEAHRYAPADSKIGFGPTRRALSRIAKEGRKYGVFLGLVTQRPAEIDATIISQCSTLFVMRLSNDRDQALIRSAVSDAAANLLSFIPSLGTGEVFAFGAGVALPTRMKFKELPPALRPTSEAGGNTRVIAGTVADRDMVASVIDRWRSSTMSQKMSFDDDGMDWSSLGVRFRAVVAAWTEPSGFEPQRPGVDAPRPAPTLEPGLRAVDRERRTATAEHSAKAAQRRDGCAAARPPRRAGGSAQRIRELTGFAHDHAQSGAS